MPYFQRKKVEGGKRAIKPSALVSTFEISIRRRLKCLQLVHHNLKVLYLFKSYNLTRNIIPDTKRQPSILCSRLAECDSSPKKSLHLIICDHLINPGSSFLRHNFPMRYHKKKPMSVEHFISQPDLKDTHKCKSRGVARHRKQSSSPSRQYLWPRAVSLASLRQPSDPTWNQRLDHPHQKAGAEL